jgi:monoamine oxidase
LLPKHFEDCLFVTLSPSIKMTTVAPSHPALQSQTLYDGSDGDSAPFKANYVSSLIDAVLEKEINQILRTKALKDNELSSKRRNYDIDTVVAAIKEERDTGRFPAEKFNHKNEPSLKIGIIGGGVAGLYAAYILKFLGIDYEILEANPDRLGGRVFTHHFTNDNKYDYYDIGAMRFPHSPIMARTFDLFRRLKMGEPNKKGDKDTVLIPYYMIGKECPTRYNDITAKLGHNEKKWSIDENGTEKQDDPSPVTQTEDDPFKVSTANGGSVPATRVSQDVTSEILDDAYGRFRQKIKDAQILVEKAKTPKEKIAAKDARQRAYEYLMRHDKFSLRDYLQNVEGYDPETVHWLETTASASGWFDQAFTENVLESLAFSYSDATNKDKPEKPTKWWCIEGGTEVMIERLVAELDKSKIFKGKAVNKMVLGDVLLRDDAKDDAKSALHNVVVTMRDHKTKVEETRKYSAVINTTTLGALQKIDMTGMDLPYGMKSAIRILRYDTSTKVGIKFKTMWWKEEFGIKLGGVAKTDLPIRVCVYPSYNIHEEGPGVLLASYTWGQDSERIAAHVSTNSPDGDKGLKELMVYNLARLHTIDVKNESKEAYEQRFEKNKKMIDDAWLCHHAYDWSKDEFSSGAFALFSPGQFSTLIPHLLRPASDGRFVVAGEHASANHAWIVGALDSSLRGLKQLLTRFSMNEELKKMIEEFQDVDELKQEQVAKQVIISMLTEDQMQQLKSGHPIQAVAQVQQT